MIAVLLAFSITLDASRPFELDNDLAQSIQRRLFPLRGPYVRSSTWPESFLSTELHHTVNNEFEVAAMLQTGFERPTPDSPEKE